MIKSSDVLEEFGIDPDELRAKYRKERDRRIRPEGDNQYIDLDGDYAEFAVDTLGGDPVEYRPEERNVQVLILGGGFAGLLSATNLIREGVDDFLIVEQGADFGGTWYWNRYPGIRCDIESYVYIPLLEEVGTVPSEKYAHGTEIYQHCRAIGKKYDLYGRALFHRVVRTIRWIEAEAQWEVLTEAGDRFLAAHVMVSSGPLHRPKLPGIPGVKTFKGKAFHTSRWDYQYTGGDAQGNLAGLQGKNIALIGTGATGIQVLPHLAEQAKNLYVVQRTPAAVDLRNNRPTDKKWFGNQPSGWQQHRIDNFVRVIMGIEKTEDLVSDCWTDNAKLLKLIEGSKNEDIKSASIEERMQLADYLKMEQLRSYCSHFVSDQETAEALKPWYDLFCKRPLFSDEYYPVFNQPNVTLVDTEGKGVDRITKDAIIVNGVSYPVDCIVFATGFRVGAYSYKSGGYELIGRNGVSLEDRWAGGQRTVHGLKTAEFPNFYIVGVYQQASQSFNYTHVTKFQTAHAAKIIAKCVKEGIRTFEVTKEAEDRWINTLRLRKKDTSQFEMECTPSYFNNEGQSDSSDTLLGSMYGGGPFEYIELLDKWLVDDIDSDTLLTYEADSSEKAVPRSG